MGELAMTTREQKNKKVVSELKKEKALNISKKIFHLVSFISIILLLFFAYIYFIGVKFILTHEYVINDNKIPQSFEGVKILHFSDLLYGSTIHKQDLEKLQKEISLINPQIVIFTGNIVNPNYNLQEDEINYLQKFFKNLPYAIGKYAVMGEYDSSTANLILENSDFTILNNEIIPVYYHTKDFINIVGLNNPTNELNIDNQLYTITLINNYDQYHQFNISSDLILAGHNLGGEIRLFNNPLLGNNKYNNAYYEEDNQTIYISNGLGSIHHLRFMNHPSINIYRLNRLTED